MRITINDQEMPGATPEDLERACDAVGQQQFGEVWIEASDDGPSLMMLVNGWRALLTYLPNHDGSPGYTSRSPSYAGALDAQIEFLLANGQMDEYPAQWTLPLSFGCAVCRDFIVRQGALSLLITWHDDTKPDDEW